MAKSYKTTLAVITQQLSLHYAFIYFLKYETPLFRIHVFRTRNLIHTSWLQKLNFKLGALRHEKRRGLAFYTGTSCLKNYYVFMRAV